MTNEHIGRNDPCYCGSEKKYKNCHYSSDKEKQAPVMSHNEADHISPRHKQFLGMPMYPNASGVGTSRAIKKAYGLLILISLFSLAVLLFNLLMN